MSTTAIAQKATSVRKTFSLETTVNTEIDADASIVWALLTNASDFPRWNSTVVSLEGEIAPGKKIRLKSTLDEKRTFKLKIKKFVPEKRMVWGDGQGKREFIIASNGKGITFTMREKIGGWMFPLYANQLPPFEDSFEQFAADLKKEAEAIAKSR